ncbi:Ankyrin repeat and SAM domain-containing protein 3 [Desmophyllum pertusum]|uniref:Ankyrin repeat and SAM domain-containing protein 3 n=1 Tax=Desmophyllum pertusum TaxID=174260 RepID=A0A9W9YX57_9CNID|nr:Ankyrin repeat and SAM domain-containing protein 3 [Desmophyllum pertusum]
MNDCSNLWNEDEVIKMDIFTACAIGRYSCVQQHLADGMELADLDRPNCGGWTPLMYAAYVRARQHRQSPPRLSCRRECTHNEEWSDSAYARRKLWDRICQNGADKELRECRLGLTPLLAAAREGHEVIFEELVRCNADMNARTKHGENVRSLARQQGNMAVVNIIDQQAFHNLPN